MTSNSPNSPLNEGLLEIDDSQGSLTDESVESQRVYEEPDYVNCYWTRIITRNTYNEMQHSLYKMSDELIMD